jgi:hypothetical protein
MRRSVVSKAKSEKEKMIADPALSPRKIFWMRIEISDLNFEIQDFTSEFRTKLE